MRKNQITYLNEEPEYFSGKDIIRAFFGALLFGITFVLKGLLVQVSKSLNIEHIIGIILATSIILTLEIYFIGYTRVTNKKSRPFAEFWAKRFFTIYFIAFLVSFFLIYLYNLNEFAGEDTWKMIVAVSMPCAIGAAIADLLKKY